MGSSKLKGKSKLRVIDTTDDDEICKGSQYIIYSSSEDTMSHDTSLTSMVEHNSIIEKEDLLIENEIQKLDHKDCRRSKHNSGKSEKSDSESHTKLNKFSRSGHNIQKSKSKSDIPDIGTMVHSDITTDEEVGSGKITSRRNSSKESRDGKSRVHGNSQTSHDSKSILDTESDTVGSNSDSDSPRKHSIFDIDIDDGKTDMYDKIKARREAYMKKQEEERHQKELKKAKMMKLKEQQRLRKEKKALAAQARDTSDSEREGERNTK